MTEEENASENHLPVEIIDIILSKLPAKSLLRFKRVSKSWNTMISDPVFVETHLKSSSDSRNLFLVKYRSIEGVFTLVGLDEGREFYESELFQSPYGCLKALCCCKGVVLLTNSYMWRRLKRSSRYVLWNPSTGMTRDLHYLSSSYYIYPMSYGVCYDPTTDDFKVVIISGSYYEVFSCNNDSWTSKIRFPYEGKGRGISVDGAVYWVLNHDEKTRQVVYFDSKTDEMKRLQKPEKLSDEDLFFLVCLRGSLCLYCKTRDETTVQIWIKERGNVENCWKELITIENLETPIRLIEPLCFVENKILIRLEGTRFVYYSPCEKTFEEFEERDLISLDLVPYVDSLFFPVVKEANPKRKRSSRSRSSSTFIC